MFNHINNLLPHSFIQINYSMHGVSLSLQFRGCSYKSLLIGTVVPNIVMDYSRTSWNLHRLRRNSRLLVIYVVSNLEKNQGQSRHIMANRGQS